MGFDRRTLSWFIFVGIILAGFTAEPTRMGAGETKKKPNIILIMADDLGYGDLGSYGQTKIKTPFLDKLSAQGMRFKTHYSGSPVCAPSRCVLMTGLHSGHAFIRDNKATGKEGQYPIPADTVTIAKVLKGLGYVTGMIGKWGLGMFDTTGDPMKQGFDFFFGYNCQAHAHNHYPTYLYRNDQRFNLEGNTGADTGKTHSHELFEEEALKFVRKNKDQPFFLYLPFTIPHLALQATENSLAEYRGVFEETPYKGKAYRHHATPRAALAAMITRMDRTVGKLMELLEELGIDKNTLVLFTSDNGPAEPGFGGVDSVFFRSASIFRGFKGSAFEGGLRVPMIAKWTGMISAGKTVDMPTAHQDFFPTLAELAGAKIPGKIDGLSLVPTLLGEGKQKTREYLYFEFPGYGGQQAVRLGNWKALRQGMQKGNLELQLFDLEKDPGESTNVAKNHPDVMARIEEILRREHVRSEVFPIKALDGKKK